MIIKSTGVQSEPCPAGNHVARCIGLIDLGTQEYTFAGKPKRSRKVLVKWELPNERKVFSEEKGEQAHVLSKEYTMSLSEKANLTKDLQSWRGKPFTEQELDGFDLKTILGVACLLMVIHNEKGYAEIASVAALPKGMTVPAQENPSEYLSLDSFDKTIFDSLPDYQKDKIKASPEYKNLGSPETPSWSDMGEEVDDIPF